MARQQAVLVALCACLWSIAAHAQETAEQAANSTASTSTTSGSSSSSSSSASSSDVTVSWIVQRAEHAAGLGIGVFFTGWVLIMFLSLVFGNRGLPEAAEGRDEAYAPASEVHVNVTQKKKQAKHTQGQFIAS
ncbi:hypothetical protein COO60DRAFT_412581 [Scenedesmus sp. NREL 46B-D3]|nr:hypothetical protein COO60DRAFT_412581 [Scenedesmus sp. NREL 46B-D3]